MIKAINPISTSAVFHTMLNSIVAPASTTVSYTHLELIGEDKREEYAKIKKNISREMTKMHDRTDRSYIRAARHLKGNPTAVSKRFSEALAELRKHMDEK